MKKISLILTAFFMLMLLFTAAELLAEVDVEQLAYESYEAAYFPGDDVRWRAELVITDRNDNVRTRELSILRKNVGEYRQKYYSFFHEPADLRRMVFMVWTQRDEDDDRWLYMPAIDMLQRITGQQKRNSFAGSDFTYEDMTGRYPELDTYVYLGEEVLDGDTVDVMRGNPRNADQVEFSYYEVYISRATKLPLKGVFYTPGGDKHRTLTLEEWEMIDGHPTPARQKAVNHRTGSTTDATMRDIEYDLGMPENVFSERYLRRPPTPWIQP